VRAYAILEESGVRNISIDLIFGLPQLSMSQWRETLDKALAISSRGVLPQHISSYQLSVEPGSMLARLVEKGRWSEASEEVCQEQYAELCSVLASAGYNHYEISNFARPGYEARHNSAYWSHTPYVGLGPGAHSFVSGHSMASFDSPLCPSSDSPLCPSNDSLHCPSSDSHYCHFERPKGVEKSSRRIWNLPDLQTYLDAFRHGDFSSVREGETLTMDQLTLEHIMLGLRTSSGLPASYLRTHCTPAALSRALSCGDLVPVSHYLSDEVYLRIPESRFFVSDSIIVNLI
jgi:oxygen-independent coproporphyrinogen-3 oxidase